MRDQQSRHPGLIHSYANAVAGHTRLRNFEQSAADAIAIADADLAVGEAFHREVLSELPECEIGSLQFTLPIVIGIHLVDKHSPVFSTVTG
jgi:nicotinamide riboside kinase